MKTYDALLQAMDIYITLITSLGWGKEAQCPTPVLNQQERASPEDPHLPWWTPMCGLSFFLRIW